MSDKKPRRVLIGTPTYDGRTETRYTLSLIGTIRGCPPEISIFTSFVLRDPLIQRARNGIIEQAIRGEFDDLIFIDSDMAWDPAWIFSLLAREEQVVGGTARKKSDAEEYAFYAKNAATLVPKANGLIPVDALGTGFLRIGREALLAVWKDSSLYKDGNKEARSVCEVAIIDGSLVSEDFVLCRKLANAGYPSWLDPSMVCLHIGVKEYSGGSPTKASPH